MIARLRIVVAVAALAVAMLSPASAGSPRMEPFAPLEEMFHAYGDAGAAWQPGQPRTWTGADSAFSVELPDGRTAWIFSDSFLSPTDGCGVGHEGICHRRRAWQPFVNNTMVVQTGDTLNETLHGGTNATPRALIEPISARTAYSFYWVGDGTVEGDELRVFVHRYPKMPTIPPFSEGNDIATFSLPDLTLQRIDEGVGFDGRVRPWAYQPGSASPVPIVWGAAVLEDAGYTYVYGTEEYPLFKHLHVARVRAGALLTEPWEYWTGSGWSQSALASARILDGVAGELSVVRAEGGYRIVTSRGGIGDVYLHRAPAPQGPWDTGLRLFTPPESARGAWAYNAKEHPQYSSSERIVLSYNVNGELDGNDIYDDVHLYRPRFVEVTL